MTCFSFVLAFRQPCMADLLVWDCEIHQRSQRAALTREMCAGAAEPRRCVGQGGEAVKVSSLLEFRHTSDRLTNLSDLQFFLYSSVMSSIPLINPSSYHPAKFPCCKLATPRAINLYTSQADPRPSEARKASKINKENWRGSGNSDSGLLFHQDKKI